MCIPSHRYLDLSTVLLTCVVNFVYIGGGFFSARKSKDVIGLLVQSLVALFYGVCMFSPCVCFCCFSGFLPQFKTY